MAGADDSRIVEQAGGADGDALATLAEHVVIGDADVDEGVERFGARFGRALAERDRDVERGALAELVGDAPAEIAADAAQVDTVGGGVGRRGRHAGDASEVGRPNHWWLP